MQSERSITVQHSTYTRVSFCTILVMICKICITLKIVNSVQAGLRASTRDVQYSTAQCTTPNIILQYNDIQYSTIQRQYYILLHIYITIRYFKYIIVLHIKVSSIVIQYSMYNIGMYRKCRKKYDPI